APVRGPRCPAAVYRGLAGRPVRVSHEACRPEGPSSCRAISPPPAHPLKRLRARADAGAEVKVAQGKPVARRGRKARDLLETARPPTSGRDIAVARRRTRRFLKCLT